MHNSLQRIKKEMDVASALFRELASLPLLGDDLPAGVLNLAHLRRAVSHEGGLNRLRCFAAKLRAGNIEVVDLARNCRPGERRVGALFVLNAC
jgi:hypothetical protein